MLPANAFKFTVMAPFVTIEGKINDAENVLFPGLESVIRLLSDLLLHRCILSRDICHY